MLTCLSMKNMVSCDIVPPGAEVDECDRFYVTSTAYSRDFLDSCITTF
jgi:hypothetical protein